MGVFRQMEDGEGLGGAEWLNGGLFLTLNIGQMVELGGDACETVRWHGESSDSVSGSGKGKLDFEYHIGSPQSFFFQISF